MLALDRETLASALINLGYQVDKNWKFSLTKDDSTPSSIVNKDGTVHSFGGTSAGFHGDLIDVIQSFHRSQFPTFGQAKNEAHRISGLEVKVNFSTYDKNTTVKCTNPMPDSFVNEHLYARKEHFKSYSKELKLLFTGDVNGKNIPVADFEKIKEVAKEFQIGFSPKSNRLIMPIRDINNRIMTFWKYQKYGEDYITREGKIIKHNKVFFTKGRDSQQLGVFEIYKYRANPELPVTLTEGEKDKLVCRANDVRAISMGSASASIAKEDLHLFEGLTIVLAGDYDKAGKQFNKRLYRQLRGIAKKIIFLSWRKKSIKDGFKLHPKFDLADYFAWNYITFEMNNENSLE